MKLDRTVDPDLQAILASLGQVICQPLDSLRGGIGRLLEDPARSISDSERGQAEVMLTLCDQLDQLTRDCLGMATPGPGPGDE